MQRNHLSPTSSSLSLSLSAAQSLSLNQRSLSGSLAGSLCELYKHNQATGASRRNPVATPPPRHLLSHPSPSCDTKATPSNSPDTQQGRNLKPQRSSRGPNRSWLLNNILWWCEFTFISHLGTPQQPPRPHLIPPASNPDVSAYPLPPSRLVCLTRHTFIHWLFGKLSWVNPKAGDTLWYPVQCLTLGIYARLLYTKQIRKK